MHETRFARLACPALMQGCKVPDGLQATGDMDALVQHAAVFLMVVPTPFVASTVAPLKDKLKPHQVRFV